MSGVGTVFALARPAVLTPSSYPPPSSKTALPLGPAGFGGQPLIVAFVDAWPELPERDVARLRAELRAVSTALVVIAPERIFAFRPDTAVDPRVKEPLCDREAFESLRGAPSSRRRLQPEGGLTLLLLNPSGSVCWSLHTVALVEVGAALIDALASARRRLLNSSGSFGISRRDLVGSLVSAFATTFGEVARSSAPPPSSLRPSSLMPASVLPSSVPPSRLAPSSSPSSLLPSSVPPPVAPLSSPTLPSPALESASLTPSTLPPPPRVPEWAARNGA